MTFLSVGIEKAIAGQIARYGYSVLRGERADLPDFCYSVGMSVRFDRPELLVFGLPVDDALDLIHEIAVRYAVHQRFEDGAVLTDILEVPLALKFVSAHAARLHAPHAFTFCEKRGQSPWFQQIVVADGAKRFPWDEGYAGASRLSRLWLDGGGLYPAPLPALTAAAPALADVQPALAAHS